MSKSLFDQFVIEPFLDSIDKYEPNNAFCINEVFYTYKDFAQHISKIRKEIKSLDRISAHVGLVVNDDIETYASIFALWLEGLAYVPLHPLQPIERCIDILDQMNLKFILDSDQNSRYKDYEVIRTSQLTYTNDFLEYNNQINDENLAYVMFTSGSTGKPKGVAISRNNVGAFMDSFWASGVGLEESDRCLQFFDLTFDISVQSYLAPLLKGACIYTIPHDQIKFSYVYGLLTDHNITFGAIAPSMLRYLRPYFDEIDAPFMKCCILGAEASPLDLILEWSRCIPNAAIYDFYGPTEATIYCTYYKLKLDGSDKSLNGMLSIGKPMKNVTAIVLSENNEILHQMEKGELCVSGNHITSGYWNNPERNAAAFITLDYNGKQERFYRTGDLCFFDQDGDIMLYGRLDSQVKIQGYRVELGEIEFHTREFLGGSNAVAVTFENKSGNTEIALFMEEQNRDTKVIVEFLKSKLPAYMIPAKMIFENTFPLNINGKVDKLKLKEKID
jgi:D-alanine--poly(phosphoribitol) ligase subunit 1